MSVITNSVFRDTSPNGFQIIPFNQPIQSSVSPASHENWSMRFNKNAQPLYINQRNTDFNFRGNDFTLETWVNVDTYNTVNTQTGDTPGYCIFSCFNKGNTQGLYVILKVNKGNNIIPQQTAVSVFYGTELLVTGNIPETSIASWFHLSITRRDSVQFTIHINGKTLNTAYKSVDIVCNTAPSIGSFNFVDSEYAAPFIGYLAGFRISNIARYNNIDFTVNTSKFIADSYTTVLLFQTPVLRDECTISSTANYIQQSGKVTSEYNSLQTVQGTQLTPYSPYSPSRNYTPSIHGGSVKLDGNSCVIAQTTNFNFGFNSWSIEMWFNPTEISNTYPMQTLFTTHGGVGNVTPGITVGLFYDDSTEQSFLTFEYEGYNTDEYSKMLPLSGYGVYDNTWSHLSFVYKNNVLDHGAGTYTPGNTVLIGYVNGRPVMVPDTSFNFDVVNSFPPVIGASFDSTTYTDFFKGSIAGVRVSNTAIKNDVLCTPTTIWLDSYTPKISVPQLTQNTTLLLNFDSLQAFDKSGKNDIVLIGQIEDSSTIKKFQNNSYKLNGSGNCLTVVPNDFNDLIFRKDFTVETWIYCLSTGHVTDPGIFQTSYNSAGVSTDYSTGIALYVKSQDSTYVLNICNSTYNSNISITPTNAPVILNAWQHIAITRENGIINFFLNGSQKQTTSIRYEHPIVASALCIGSHINTAKTFKGYIDNFRVTKDFARYSSSFAPPTQPFNFI